MHLVEKRSLNLRPRPLGKILLEMAMIVFSILLALGLESWNAGRHERRLADEALRNIRTELAGNKEAVQAALPRQEKLIADLDAVVRRRGRDDAGVTLGLMPPRLFRTAWETAAATQALARADYGLVLAVARPYDSQRWMALVEEKWLQAILNPAAFDPANRLRFLEILKSVVAEYAALEKRLLPEVDGALERLARR